nr:hypothetical protein GCM10025699_21920 [Microbacterium flavescens]
MSFLEYAPAPESRAILNLRDEYGLFIGGEFRPGNGESFASISPADEKHIATIATATEADVDAAVAAARRAYDKTWSKLSGRDRGKYLFRIARLVQERARELAVAESLDNGKPIKESRDVDVPLVAAWFFYYAGWADKLDYAGLGANPRSLGVAGQVIPWNFPCSCSRGRSRRRSPRATRSSSSRLRPRRCRRSSSPRSCSRPTCRRASSTS